MLPTVVLSERGKKRYKLKHPWIFSNEIESRPQVEPGELVEIKDLGGHSLGLGYYNIHTLIAVRILSYRVAHFDLQERVQNACQLREQIYAEPVYRLIFAESDYLPGLIVDRYHSTLVVQILTAGMERMRDEILQALIESINPARILLRNDSAYRKLEGLPLATEWVHGNPVDEEIIEVDGIRSLIDYRIGQKTGFFLDQQENRRRLAAYTPANSMLDVFSYSGGWTLYGAKAGIKDILAVDVSEAALGLSRRNAELNGYSITTIAEDAFEFLRAQYSLPRRYDLIVLDPPAFCKSKRQLPAALKGYREINLRAMKLLSPGGIVFSCSCSQPVTPDIFEDILRAAAADSGRNFLLRELRLQPPDHPILLNFPESQYLKCAVLQVL